MQNEFSDWLAQNNLTEVFTTNAGDTLYVNSEKRFAVLKKSGTYTTQAFYFDHKFHLFDHQFLWLHYVHHIFCVIHFLRSNT